MSEWLSSYGGCEAAGTDEKIHFSWRTFLLKTSTDDLSRNFNLNLIVRLWPDHRSHFALLFCSSVWPTRGRSPGRVRSTAPSAVCSLIGRRGQNAHAPAAPEVNKVIMRKPAQLDGQTLTLGATCLTPAPPLGSTLNSAWIHLNVLKYLRVQWMYYTGGRPLLIFSHQ